MRLILGLYCLLLFLSFPRPVMAETLRLTNGEYPPYMSQHLPHYGFWSHLVTEAYALEGVQVEYGFFPWKRSLMLAENATWDGSIGFAKTPQRLTKLHYSNTSLGKISIVFFHRADYPFDWADIDNLSGIKIGVMQGYSTAEELELVTNEGKGLSLNYSTTEILLFRQLLARRIDVFPAARIPSTYILENAFAKEDVGKITTHPRIWKEQELFMIYPLSAHKTEKYSQLFDSGMKKLKESGRYQELMNDFRNGKYHTPVN